MFPAADEFVSNGSDVFLACELPVCFLSCNFPGVLQQGVPCFKCIFSMFKCDGSLSAPYGLVLTHPASLLRPSLHPLAPFLSQIARLRVVLHLLICLLARKLKLTCGITLLS